MLTQVIVHSPQSTQYVGAIARVSRVMNRQLRALLLTCCILDSVRAFTSPQFRLSSRRLPATSLRSLAADDSEDLSDAASSAAAVVDRRSALGLLAVIGVGLGGSDSLAGPAAAWAAADEVSPSPTGSLSARITKKALRQPPFAIEVGSF